MRWVNTKQRSARLATWIFLAVLGLSGLGVNPGRSQVEAESSEAKANGESYAGKVLVIPIRADDLNDRQRFGNLVEMLELAGKDGSEAAAVVFDMNMTDSGDWASDRRLLEEMPKVGVPTFAFVNPSALAAGTTLAVSTDAIYMSPVGIIGGAGLVGGEEVENEEAYRRETAQHLSVLKARARSLAISKGYRPEVVEAFIDPDIEVKIGDTVISKKGEILTLTAAEAVRVIDGKPLLAKAIATDIADLLRQESISAGVLRQSPLDHQGKRNRPRLGGGSRSENAEDGSPATISADGGDAPGIFGRRLEDSYAGKILVMEIGADALATGEARFKFMERVLRKADLDGAEAVIFDMDTPGGYAWYTEGLVLNVLQDLRVPSFTFVNTRAESAGAIIAMGTDTIYMRPAATIGSALTVTAVGDLEGDMKSKVDQMAVALVRNMAALKGHNPDVAEAFVVRTKEVRVNGELIHPAGEVLNLNTIRATEEHEGRPLLAKGIVDSIEELVEREGLKGEIVVLEPLGLERFAHLVQKFSIALLLLGFAGAWAEMKVPGFGVAGMVSLICFGMFFFGNHLAGNLAGYELAVLLVIGFILLAVEIFIVPGTLVAGFVGGVMILAALAMAMVDRVDFGAALEGAPTASGFGDLIVNPLLNVLFALGGSIIVLFFLLRYLPKVPVMRWLVLREAVTGGGSLDDGTRSSAGVRGVADGAGAVVRNTLVGSDGEAVTDLRPAGKGRFGDRLLDITADGEFLDRGTPLRVIRHEGSLIVVEAV